MRIKIHKGFRAVLSVFVAVMLLVGIMPTQVWQGTKVSATGMVFQKGYLYLDRSSFSNGNNWYDRSIWLGLVGSSYMEKGTIDSTVDNDIVYWDIDNYNI